MSIAFFCRAKPQYCDAFETFRTAGYVFIGWPLIHPEFRDNQDQIDPVNLKYFVVNPSRYITNDEDWEAIMNNLAESKWSYTRNRNFISEIDQKLAQDERVIVLIPRPTEGLAYLANVINQFEVVDAPNWGENYLQLRRECNLPSDGLSHILDVAQGWRVDEYVEVPFSNIPGWIRKSILGNPRGTYQYLNSDPLEHKSAYEYLEKLLRDPTRPILDWKWSLEIVDIKRRLIDTQSPSSFESLVVCLLQLEYPEKVWIHTGGPGDGGVDGFGYDPINGEFAGQLQAKLSAPSMPELNIIPDKQNFVAVLYPHEWENNYDDIELLDLGWVAEAVKKHWECLPQARSLRIGE